MRPSGVDKKVYTIAEINDRYNSGDYSSELLLQHLMIRVGQLGKIVEAVGKCVRNQRLGLDVLASSEWDNVVRIWDSLGENSGDGKIAEDAARITDGIRALINEYKRIELSEYRQGREAGAKVAQSIVVELENLISAKAAS